jgi:hyperosmotically inducible periplasmic protein
MKEQYLRIGRWVVLLLLGGALAAEVGCSSTQYRRSAGTYLDDKATTAKVKTALLKDDIVNGFNIDVTTYRGEVDLSGFVDTPQQKARAAEVAQNIPGVQAVVNGIVVKPGTAVGGPAPVVSGSGGQLNTASPNTGTQ